MKKLVLLGASLLMMLGMNAQTWNVSEMAAGAYTETTTTLATDMVVYAGAETAVTIDANNKTFDEVAYTQRMKMGGAGNFDATGAPVSRVVEITIPGPGTLSVCALSSSSSADRICNVADGTLEDAVDAENNPIKKQTVLAELAAPGTTTGTAVTYAYAGASKKLYLYSPASGINIYNISFTAGGSSSISNVNAEAAVVATEYYNVAGQKVVAPAGVTIVKQTLSNGKVKVSKVIK